MLHLADVKVPSFAVNDSARGNCRVCVVCLRANNLGTINYFIIRFSLKR